MSRLRDDGKVSRETLERKYHEARAEIHQLRAQLASEGQGDETILPEMEEVLRRAVGYWRVGLSSNGHYWARYKWTQGDHAGRYAIGGHSSLPYAILACLADISLIESGKKVAPLDIGYRK